MSAAPPRTGPEIWAELARPLPRWFEQAKLGIFIHWGPYSVPAWAEPTGALGAVAEEEWFPHNPYAEWYYNTIRIEGSPAAQRQQSHYGGAPYDDFLDAWSVPDFDPGAWAQLFAEAGAEYVIPTTKHHDGVALWDAPGTGARNTVHRGPRRDLVGEIAQAVRAAGMRFGTYYSGGLDWSTSDLPPLTTFAEVHGVRPVDAAYNTYAYLHVSDLIDRYAPDVLWNDIEWPDAGKRTGVHSLHELFRSYYGRNPDGVVNDRWGDTHWDFRTSEYEHGRGNEQQGAWENCRGIGFSFGYNQLEGEEQTLTGPQLASHLTDVVSRGGRFLLNVGPTSAGRIPELQERSLRALARWMSGHGELLRASQPVAEGTAQPSDEPWVRWLATPTHLVALVGGAGETVLRFAREGLDASAASLLAARGAVEQHPDGLEVRVEEVEDGPVAVVVPRR
jgi:alpha-L-fucosidase